MAEVIELQKLKLAELRQECEARGLDTKGNKGELITRLQTYLEEHGEEEDVDVDDVLAEDTEDFTKVETANNVKVSKDSDPECETPTEKKVVKITPPSSASEVNTDKRETPISDPDNTIPRINQCPDSSEEAFKEPLKTFLFRQRLQKRAERFNLPASAESKKAIRAARFGLPTDASSPSPGLVANSKSAVNVDQLKKRAERFGMNVSSISQKMEEDEKLKKRKERFGILTSAGSGGADDIEAKKVKRAERFGKV